MSERLVTVKLTRIEANAVLDALDADITLRLEAARDEFGDRIPGEDIAAIVPAQKRAERKVKRALCRPSPKREVERG